MEYQCTKERFLEDVKNHKMEIDKDDGVYRRIIFKQPNSNNYRFEFITWPGYLCVAGDMGEWVFSRVHDMFEFFIMRDNDFNKKNIINPHYWAGKLKSIAKHSSVEEFSKQLFVKNITDYFDNYFAHRDDEDFKKEVWEDIELEILHHIEDYDGSEDICSYLVHDFESGKFIFEDFYPDNRIYTFRYIWICYAIVWGITQYNTAKEYNRIKAKGIPFNEILKVI
jgi:hypothetical protein